MSKEWPIVVRFTINEEDRRSIAAFYGDKGMAKLADCRKFLVNAAYADLSEIADVGSVDDEFAEWRANQ